MAEIYLHHRKDKRLYASVYRSVFSPGSHNHQPKISFEIVLMNVGCSKRNTCELSLSWLYIYIYHKHWWFLYLLSVIVLTLEPFCLYRGFSCTIGKLPSFYPKYFFSCLSLIFDCLA